MRLFSQRAVSFLRIYHNRLFSHPDAHRLLKERNARLIVHMKESQSFYGQRLYPETLFSIGGNAFQIHINLLSSRMLSISISDDHSQNVLLKQVAIGSSALALSVNLDTALLKIEFDADAPVRFLQ
jgi:hypothetical protein